MPLLRFQGLPARKRSRLLEIAAQQFAEKGFEAASLNEILAAAGLGKSSYYYYFEDKEDLYATCIFDSFEKLLAQLPQFPLEKLDAKTFWPIIDDYFFQVLKLVQGYPLQMRLFRELPATKTRLAHRFRNVALAWMEPMVDVIRKGQALGVVRSDLDAARLFRIGMAADNALDESIAEEHPRFDLQAHTKVVLDMWKRIVSPAPKGRRVA